MTGSSSIAGHLIASLLQPNVHAPAIKTSDVLSARSLSAYEDRTAARLTRCYRRSEVVCIASMNHLHLMAALKAPWLASL